MTRQGTGIAALIVGFAIVAGGAYVATNAFSSSSPAAATAASQQPASPPAVGQQSASPAQQAGTTPAVESAQAVALSSAITDISAPASTSAQRSAQARRARLALHRLRMLGGEHGEFTYRIKDGTSTLAFERGTIQSVAGSDVTVRAADGTTWTWALTSASVVHEDGSRTSSSALSSGELVFAAGPVTGTARDAQLIVIRKSATPAKPPASTAPAAS